MRKIKILIVEDEAITAMFLKGELQARGYADCAFLPDGEKALQFVSREAPELILMDIRLARGPDGLETARLIKKKAPRTAFIFLTGYEDAKLKEKALLLKPLGYLTKPLDIEETLDLINRHFQT